MSETEGENQEQSESFLQHWGVLIVMSLASFILVLDTTMMNVAIGAIVEDLNTTIQGVQSAITVYALVMASFMLMGAKLGDIYGMKKTFTVGMILYGIGTLTAALTPNLLILVLGWSVIEGLGAALVLPMTITLLALKYQGKQLALGFGVVGGVQAAGAAVGPIFGGFMTSEYSWRWAFASEALIVLVIFALLFVLPESKRNKEISLDWMGVFLSAAGLATIVFGIILSSTYGWFLAKRPFTIGNLDLAPFGLSIVPFLVAAGLILLIAFAHWSRRRERRGKMPLFHMRLLKNSALLAGVLAGGILNIILGGIMFVTPVFLQAALGFSAIDSGIAILPMSLAILVFALGTAGLGRRISPKYVIEAGLLIMLAGTFMLYNAISMDLTIRDLAPGFVIFGMGVGLVLAQITNVTLSSVADEDNNEASGLNYTFRQLGTSMGTAIIGSILMTLALFGVTSSLLQAVDIDATRGEIREYSVALEDSLNEMSDVEKQAALEQLSPESLDLLVQIKNNAWVDAMKSTLIAVVFTIIFAMLASSFLPRKKLA